MAQREMQNVIGSVPAAGGEWEVRGFHTTHNSNRYPIAVIITIHNIFMMAMAKIHNI